MQRTSNIFSNPPEQIPKQGDGSSITERCKLFVENAISHNAPRPKEQIPQQRDGSSITERCKLFVEKAISQKTTGSLDQKQNEHTTEEKVVAVVLALGIIGVLFLYPIVCIPATSVALHVSNDPTQSIPDSLASYDPTKGIRNMTPLSSTGQRTLPASLEY